MSDKPEQLVVTVDRSKWRCGGVTPTRHGEGRTLLLNSEGYQCCLGFACEQMGLERHQLINVGAPSKYIDFYCLHDRDSWQPVVDKLRPYMYVVDDEHLGIKPVVVTCVTINDDIGMSNTREEREAKLVEATKDAPFTFRFVGEYEPLGERKDNQ